MTFFKLLTLFLVFMLTFSCVQQNKKQAVHEITKISPKMEGPHAISFAHFVKPRPFIPFQHFLEMDKKGARFYSEGSPISFTEVKKLLDTRPVQHIQTTGSGLANPTVDITFFPIESAELQADYGARTDPAAVLIPYAEQEVVYYIGEQPATIEEVQKVFSSSEFPVRMYTVQIDDDPLMLRVLNGC